MLKNELTNKYFDIDIIDWLCTNALLTYLYGVVYIYVYKELWGANFWYLDSYFIFLSYIRLSWNVDYSLFSSRKSFFLQNFNVDVVSNQIVLLVTNYQVKWVGLHCTVYSVQCCSVQKLCLLLDLSLKVISIFQSFMVSICTSYIYEKLSVRHSFSMCIGTTLII